MKRYKFYFVWGLETFDIINFEEIVNASSYDSSPWIKLTVDGKERYINLNTVHYIECLGEVEDGGEGDKALR